MRREAEGEGERKRESAKGRGRRRDINGVKSICESVFLV